MSITLVDFSDIYTAIMEELKIQSSDTVTKERIKRDINMVYLNEVVPFKPWWWLSKSQDLQTETKITTGTVEVTQGSNTITFSSAPSISVTGYRINITGYAEILEITSHTASSTTATLKSAYTGTTDADATYTAWKNYAALDADVRQTTQVRHDHFEYPLDCVGYKKFRQIEAMNPLMEGRPRIYTTEDFDSDGQRIMRWYPSIYDTKTTLHVEAMQEATRLSQDADEPAMPLEDRIVLFYGGAAKAWARERDEESASKNWGEFQRKLRQMAARSQDGVDPVHFDKDNTYLLNIRYGGKRRHRKRGASWRSD